MSSSAVTLAAALTFSALLFLRPSPLKKEEKKIIVKPEIHRKLYQMMKFFDHIAKKHNIKYFIAFGTLLGAVREKAIIRWDDDMDLMMESSELDKLRNLDPSILAPFVLDFRDHIWRINLDNQYPYIDIFEMKRDENNTKLTFKEEANRIKWPDEKFSLDLKDVYPLTEYPIGNLILSGPRSFDKILTNAYGNYMTPVYWDPHQS